jgi:hypothetical protein
MFKAKQKLLVNVLLFVMLLLLLVYYFIFPEDFRYFNLPEILITTVPILSYIMIHLYNSLEVKGEYLYISGALLVYLSISSLVFLLYALGVKEEVLNKETSSFISNINIVCYVILQIVIFLEWKLNISKWKPKKVL